MAGGVFYREFTKWNDFRSCRAITYWDYDCTFDAVNFNKTRNDPKIKKYKKKR